MPNMIFHVPFPLDPTSRSASGLRPQRMREAFETSGYTVWTVSGHARERRHGIGAVRKAMREGTQFEFCYSESATMPTTMTEPHHLPTHPLLDFGFLAGLRRSGVRVGLFYRDIYWRFPDYGVGLNPLKRQAALAAYRYDMRRYRSAVDILYVPSEPIKKHVDPTGTMPMKQLPPAHSIAQTDAAEPNPLHLLYVGGIGAHYRLHELVKAVASMPHVQLVLCCRTEDWQAARAEYEPLLTENIEVVHRSGAELEELYTRANVAVLCTEPNQYWNFANPVKMYEYLGHGTPIIASFGGVSGDFVKRNNVGWVVEYGEAPIRALLSDLGDHPDVVTAAHKRVLAVRGEHTWQARAAQVAADLGRKAHEDHTGLPSNLPRRLLLVGDGASIHTARWANSMAERGLEVHLATLTPPSGQHYRDDVQVHLLPMGTGKGYLLAAPALARLVRRLNPDVVNTHYASGYGTLTHLGLMFRSQAYLLSVWGTDVYDFPASNAVNRTLLKGNLDRATLLASTSQSMADHTRQYCGDRSIVITPFGVDEERFAARGPVSASAQRVVVGTVKALTSVYGIDTLIEAFAIATQMLGVDYDLQLVLVGKGPDREALEALAHKLGVAEKVQFRGAIPHELVPSVMQGFDIYAGLSRRESFGVAILEAGACGLPVVVSDVSGPAEVTEDDVTGIIVPKEDPQAAAEAIVALVRDPARRQQMGEAGRRHVVENYTWNASVDRMLEAYEQTLVIHRGATGS